MLPVMAGNYDIPEDVVVEEWMLKTLRRMLTVDPAQRPDILMVLDAFESGEGIASGGEAASSKAPTSKAAPRTKTAPRTKAPPVNAASAKPAPQPAWQASFEPAEEFDPFGISQDTQVCVAGTSHHF